MEPSSWITYLLVVLFVIHILFFAIMSFVSPFQKALQKNVSLAVRIINVVFSVIIFAVICTLAILNTRCHLGGDERSCQLFSYVLVATIGTIITFNIIGQIMLEIRYKKNPNMIIYQEAKIAYY
jgi:hypothetical protein